MALFAVVARTSRLSVRDRDLAQGRAGRLSVNTVVQLMPSPKCVATGKYDHPWDRFHVNFEMINSQIHGPVNPDLLSKRILLAD